MLIRKLLLYALAIITLVAPLSIIAQGSASAAIPGSDAEFNITSSPLPIQLTTTPGKPVSTDLRVQNSGTKTTAIKITLLKFKSSDKTGKPLLIKQAPGDTFFNWVTFSKTRFVAQPGEWNTITMTINPPEGAAYGYYYAVLFSQDSPKESKVTKLTGATATLVLLNVHVPGEKRKLEVTSFTSEHKLYEYLPVNFNIAVKNTGNVHLVPAGDIFISRGHNKSSLAVLSFNPNAGNVLPNSTRNFAASWTDGFPVFTTKRDHEQIVTKGPHGKPIEELKYDFSKTNKLRFGHYYAHLLLTYNDGDRDIPVEAEVGFWVLPWKAMPVIFIFFLLFLVGLFSVLKSLKHKIKKPKPKPKQRKPDNKPRPKAKVRKIDVN